MWVHVVYLMSNGTKMQSTIAWLLYSAGKWPNDLVPQRLRLPNGLILKLWKILDIEIFFDSIELIVALRHHAMSHLCSISEFLGHSNFLGHLKFFTFNYLMILCNHWIIWYLMRWRYYFPIRSRVGLKYGSMVIRFLLLHSTFCWVTLASKEDRESEWSPKILNSW